MTIPSHFIEERMNKEKEAEPQEVEIPDLDYDEIDREHYVEGAGDA